MDKFRILEWFTEAIGWILITLSPLLLGTIIGVLIILPNPSTPRLILGGLSALAGLITGILWANKQWKGKGTVWFLSQLIATPDLDAKQKKEDKTIGQDEPTDP